MFLFPQLPPNCVHIPFFKAQQFVRELQVYASNEIICIERVIVGALRITVAGFVRTVAGGAASGVGGVDGVGTNVFVSKAWGVAADSVGGAYFTSGDGCTLRYIDSNGKVSFIVFNCE